MRTLFYKVQDGRSAYETKIALSIYPHIGFDSQDDIDDTKEKQFTDKVNEKLQNIIAEMKVGHF